jgi:hypothetical protein
MFRTGRSQLLGQEALRAAMEEARRVAEASAIRETKVPNKTME